MKPIRLFDERLPKRFWSKVTLDAVSGCWLWSAALSHADDDGGYGVFWFNGKLQRAHRVSYAELVGPIPKGLTLDHLCRVRQCVNPSHLEPVSDRTNILRGSGASAINYRKTSCKHGHPLIEENLFNLKRGWRSCKACDKRYKRERSNEQINRKRKKDREYYKENREAIRVNQRRYRSKRNRLVQREAQALGPDRLAEEPAYAD